MPAQCVAWNCSTKRYGDGRDDPTVTFHSFPQTRPGILAQWLENMGETTWRPQRGNVLCSRHFEKDCFLQNYFQPRLKQNAVPTMFERRPPNTDQSEIEKRAYRKDEDLKKELAREELASGRKRKLTKENGPAEEIDRLRTQLVDERMKRKELELEVFRLRQERAEMNAKMAKLETAKVKPNIPQNLIPIVVDALAKGVDPFKKPPPKPRQVPAPRAPITKKPAPQKTTTPQKTASAQKNATPAKNGASAGKVVIQLPQQVVDTSPNKSVSFLVPVSQSNGTSTTATDAATSNAGAPEPGPSTSSAEAEVVTVE